MDFIGPTMGGNIYKPNLAADYPSIMTVASILADKLETVFLNDSQEFSKCAF